MIGLPLWLKYQQRAYLYYVLIPPYKSDSSFEILLEGVNCKIHLDSTDTWVESHEAGKAVFDTELIQLIGKAVISHFHIRKQHYH